jgi:hypothetical protein
MKRFSCCGENGWTHFTAYAAPEWLADKNPMARMRRETGDERFDCHAMVWEEAA